jgi:adenylate cyclase
MPHQPPDPEKRAIQTALEMIQRLHNIQRDTGELINIGIGINTGPAIAGYLGSADYVEFSVLGYPVNIAWALENNARPNRIIIGHSTYQAVKDNFQINSIGEIEFKQKYEPIKAYEVVQPPE